MKEAGYPRVAAALAVAAAVSAAVLILGVRRQGRPEAPPTRGGPAPAPPAAPARTASSEHPPAEDFALPDLQGRTVRLSEFRGKVVLLDFWATWCGPCIDEIPDLKAIHAKYSRRGFTLVGVAMDEDGREVVGPFVKESGLPYPILISPDGKVEGYRVRGIPTAYLIDRGGRVIKRYVGPKDRAEVERDLEPLLASPS